MLIYLRLQRRCKRYSINIFHVALRAYFIIPEKPVWGNVLKYVVREWCYDFILLLHGDFPFAEYRVSLRYKVLRSVYCFLLGRKRILLPPDFCQGCACGRHSRYRCINPYQIITESAVYLIIRFSSGVVSCFQMDRGLWRLF